MESLSQRGGFFSIGAWQRADDLAVKTYQVTEKFPRHQLYSLTAQMQKAAVSVAANIAEGSGRHSLADYIRFLYIAKGSLFELEYYIHLANRLGYLEAQDHNELQRLQRMTAGALLGFIEFKEGELRREQLP